MGKKLTPISLTIIDVGPTFACYLGSYQNKYQTPRSAVYLPEFLIDGAVERGRYVHVQLGTGSGGTLAPADRAVQQRRSSAPSLAGPDLGPLGRRVPSPYHWHLKHTTPR